MSDQLKIHAAELSASEDPSAGSSGPTAAEMTRHSLRLSVENISDEAVFVISTITTIGYEHTTRTLEVGFDERLLTTHARQPSLTEVPPRSRKEIEGRIFSPITFGRGPAHLVDGARVEKISIAGDVDTLAVAVAFTTEDPTTKENLANQLQQRHTTWRHIDHRMTLARK